jgi:hypothetical protein
VAAIDGFDNQKHLRHVVAGQEMMHCNQHSLYGDWGGIALNPTQVSSIWPGGRWVFIKRYANTSRLADAICIYLVWKGIELGRI